jgi:catechol 2,3-dioxygenase-like lactoylglutathione lyase family enzyme
MKFEAVVIPVSDVDRAKEFYARLGWRLDADVVSGAGSRLIQFTPPGSGCSIQFGANLFGATVASAAPGSLQGLYLIVSDIEAARDELIAHGADASEVFHCATPSATPTATAGCCRRSRPGLLGESILPRLRLAPRATWQARYGVRRPPTASTRSASATPIRTGPTGMPTTWRASSPARSCLNE